MQWSFVPGAFPSAHLQRLLTARKEMPAGNMEHLGMRRVECDLWTCAANTLLLRGDLRTPYCTSSVLLPATPSMYNCTYIPYLTYYTCSRTYKRIRRLRLGNSRQGRAWLAFPILLKRPVSYFSFLFAEPTPQLRVIRFWGKVVFFGASFLLLDLVLVGRFLFFVYCLVPYTLFFPMGISSITYR
jgi:hypothetical protein